MIPGALSTWLTAEILSALHANFANHGISSQNSCILAGGHGLRAVLGRSAHSVQASGKDVDYLSATGARSLLSKTGSDLFRTITPLAGKPTPLKALTGKRMAIFTPTGPGCQIFSAGSQRFESATSFAHGFFHHDDDFEK
ncbi:hypothetical protein KL905_002949 [Ogataea polymorpha]|nr:hypothetical protein KL937_002507 [Ogataea polymorpha]KAG7904878.1 hypothetical protein KL907_003094 [Ogataea polymorpha]KAG7916584.1 hypothetical protein KL927_003223 [Ogataea polymorpha]KAG7921491.1 hypothetical protein KL905_002949 [Ogataea polymorpha]KAG7933947.1 hypothetical protein KL934_002869 [Ogataea polymorpha]